MPRDSIFLQLQLTSSVGKSLLTPPPSTMRCRAFSPRPPLTTESSFYRRDHKVVASALAMMLLGHGAPNSGSLSGRRTSVLLFHQRRAYASLGYFRIMRSLWPTTMGLAVVVSSFAGGGRLVCNELGRHGCW
jgi:hypothetical protein